MTEKEKVRIRKKFKSEKKWIWMAYFMWLFWFHYLYLRKYWTWVLYVLSFIIFVGYIWLFVDIFRIPKMVEELNEDILLDIKAKARGLFDKR